MADGSQCLALHNSGNDNIVIPIGARLTLIEITQVEFGGSS